MLSAKLVESIPQAIRILRKFTSESLSGAITFQQYRVLALVKEGQGQTQISETVQVSLAATSKMINSLISKKLITRKAGQDRRTQILTLTPKGKSTLDKIRKEVARKMDFGIVGLSAAEKTQLLDGLMVLDKLILKLKEV